jgi:hypothetical protein
MRMEYGTSIMVKVTVSIETMEKLLQKDIILARQVT